MSTTRPRIAFYAPMKSPEHPTPSGDRRIARLTLQALDLAGFDADVVSHLRTLDKMGDPFAQSGLMTRADTEVEKVLAELRRNPPALWYTYHCHYKAPDLIGPRIAAALHIPYVIAEPSVSPRRREGAWARFANLSEQAIAHADRLLWTTTRDCPALEAAGHGRRMVHLPAFVDAGPVPSRQVATAARPLSLLTVAMMRPGDKLESYRRLAAMLPHLTCDWTLDVIGDGPAGAEVEALFRPHASHVNFHGACNVTGRLRSAYEAADLFVWPGVGEGVGMVYLEAQAAGLPVLAEDHPAQRDLVAAPLAPPGDPAAAADLAVRLARHPHASATARAHIEAHHSIEAAAEILSATINGLIA